MANTEKRQSIKEVILPEIPQKQYFSISEVADLCAVEKHVLRYWEQMFEELSPQKRRGNRRYYTRNDVLLIRRIRELLYLEGFTISGAKRHLTSETQAKPLKDSDNGSDSLDKLVLELNGVLEILS